MNLPSLPDNVHKLFMLLGIFVIVYFYLEAEKSRQEVDSKQSIVTPILDETQINLKKQKRFKQKLLSTADLLSSRYKVENPLVESKKDSILTFVKVLSGGENEVFVSDSLTKMWEQYDDMTFNIETKLDQSDKHIAAMKQAIKDHESFMVWHDRFMLLGFLFIVIGLFGMLKQQDIQDKLLNAQIYEKGTFYHWCQSCGKRFSPTCLRGKNSDNSTNNAFCSNCYDNGQFTEPELTHEEFKKRVKIELGKRKYKPSRIILAARFAKLERWNEDEFLG